MGIWFLFCRELKIWTLRQGPTCITVPNLIKIGQKVADIWWYNGFQNGSCPPSWIFEIQFLTVWEVERPMLHQRTKFRKDRSNRCGEVAIFVIFQDGGRRHLGFSKIWNFNGRSAVRVQCASLYQISSKSVKRLRRYGDLTVFSKWRPSAILDMLGAYWDHPRRPLDGLRRCAKI